MPRWAAWLEGSHLINTHLLSLTDMWRPTDIADYKLHFARWNGQEQPVDAMARSFEAWESWQAWHPENNMFNRKHIFSLAHIPDSDAEWMFGGIWDVLGTESRDGRLFYRVALAPDLRAVVGRLVLHCPYSSRATRVNLEGQIDAMTVCELRRNSICAGW